MRASTELKSCRRVEIGVYRGAAGFGDGLFPSASCAARATRVQILDRPRQRDPPRHPIARCSRYQKLIEERPHRPSQRPRPGIPDAACV